MATGRTTPRQPNRREPRRGRYNRHVRLQGGVAEKTVLPENGLRGCVSSFFLAKEHYNNNIATIPSRDTAVPIFAPDVYNRCKLFIEAGLP